MPVEGAIYAVDVGSPKSGLAWARLLDRAEAEPTHGTDFAALAREISTDIGAARAVALGFEAPCFVPMPLAFGDLCHARDGERDRAWCVNAGAYTTAVNVQLSGWLLREIRQNVGEHRANLTVDASSWGQSSLDVLPPVLLWEAFVSGKSHARGGVVGELSEHVRDAITAARSFREWAHQHPRRPSDVTAPAPLSILGAAALWSGWTTDLHVLETPVLVLRPEGPSPGLAKPEFEPSAASPEGQRYRCPIPGCTKVFHGSRGGWDGHVDSLKNHPSWEPTLTGHARHQKFREKFPDFFE